MLCKALFNSASRCKCVILTSPPVWACAPPPSSLFLGAPRSSVASGAGLEHGAPRDNPYPSPGPCALRGRTARAVGHGLSGSSPTCPLELRRPFHEPLFHLQDLRRRLRWAELHGKLLERAG